MIGNTCICSHSTQKSCVYFLNSTSANTGLLIAVYFCIAFVLLYFRNCLTVHCIVSFLAFRLQLLNKHDLTWSAQLGYTVPFALYAPEKKYCSIVAEPQTWLLENTSVLWSRPNVWLECRVHDKIDWSAAGDHRAPTSAEQSSTTSPSARSDDVPRMTEMLDDLISLHKQKFGTNRWNRTGKYHCNYYIYLRSKVTVIWLWPLTFWF